MTFGAVRSPSLVAMRSTESPCAVSRDRDSPPRPNLRSSQFDGRRQAIHPRQKHGATRVELSTSPVRCAITQHHANTRRQPTSIPPTTFLPRKNVRSWYANRQTFPLQNYLLTCLEKQQEESRRPASRRVAAPILPRSAPHHHQQLWKIVGVALATRGGQPVYHWATAMIFRTVPSPPPQTPPKYCVAVKHHSPG